MRYYAGFDTVAEASKLFNRLREQEAQGKVRWVNLSELSEAVRMPHDKPYLVSWHEWAD